MCFPAAPTTLRAHANLPLTRYFIPLPVSLQNRLGVFANGTVGTNVLPSLEALLGTTPRGFGLEPPPQLPPPSSPASPRVSGGGAVGASDAATGGTDDASGSETDTDAVPDLHDANAELALRRGALLPLMWHAVQKPSHAMQRSLGASLTEAHSPPSSPLRGFDFDAIARRRPELAGPLREFRDALALRRQHAASPPPTPGAGGVTSTSGQGNVQQMLQEVLQQLSGTGAASTGASNAAVGDAHAAPGAQPQTFQLVQQADGSVQIVLQQSPNAADANAATAAGASSLLARSARSAAATPPLSQPSTSPSPPPVVGDRVTVHAPVQGFSCAATVRYIGGTSFKGGEWVGLQLDRPLGKNDGSVEGVRYFTCPAGYGLFVRPSRVEPLREPPRTLWDEFRSFDSAGSSGGCAAGEAATGAPPVAGGGREVAAEAAAAAATSTPPGDDPSVADDPQGRDVNAMPTGAPESSAAPATTAAAAASTSGQAPTGTSDATEAAPSEGEHARRGRGGGGVGGERAPARTTRTPSTARIRITAVWRHERTARCRRYRPALALFRAPLVRRPSRRPPRPAAALPAAPTRTVCCRTWCNAGLRSGPAGRTAHPVGRPGLSFLLGGGEDSRGGGGRRRGRGRRRRRGAPVCRRARGRARRHDRHRQGGRPAARPAGKGRGGRPGRAAVPPLHLKDKTLDIFYRTRDVELRARGHRPFVGDRVVILKEGDPRKARRRPSSRTTPISSPTGCAS